MLANPKDSSLQTKALLQVFDYNMCVCVCVSNPPTAGLYGSTCFNMLLQLKYGDQSRILLFGNCFTNK